MTWLGNSLFLQGSAGDKSLDSEQQDLDDTADDETENFSDIDDVEVCHR